VPWVVITETIRVQLVLLGTHNETLGPYLAAKDTILFPVMGVCIPQAFVDKFRFNAKRASLVQSRIKALERMAEVDAVVVDPDYVFR
jgi:ABC transporter